MIIFLYNCLYHIFKNFNNCSSFRLYIIKLIFNLFINNTSKLYYIFISYNNYIYNIIEFYFAILILF